MDISIRLAREEDAEELLNIYAYYVENTAISFEQEVPSLEDFTGRIKETLWKDFICRTGKDFSETKYCECICRIGGSRGRG